MTRLQFMEECGKRLIDFSLAAENEAIQEALNARDDKKIIHLLDTEF